MYTEKRRVGVRISQFGQDPLDGVLCLASLTGVSHEPQTVFELLNSSQRVIPFIVSDDGSVILLTRRNLEWVMTVEDTHQDLILPSSYVIGRQEAVKLEFMNGTIIDGLIQMEVTEQESRASDFLNSPADFYPVLTRMGFLLVNKARVRSTRLSTASPQWKSSAA